jgi:hypothetical protein
MIDNLISFNITSRNRISGSTHDFNINLDLPTDLITKFTHISITDISIPKSFYQIEQGRNNFSLYEDNELININLPEGNYTKNQLFTYLKMEMTL